MRGTVMEHAMPSGTMLGSFFLISGLITVFMVGPWWLFDRNQSERIRSDISATSRRREEGKSGIEMKDVKSVR